MARRLLLRLGSGSSCFRSVSSPHTTFCCAEGEYSSRRPRQCSCSGECASFSGRERDVQQLHHCDDGLKVTSPLRQLFGLGPICSTSGAARQGEEIMLQQSTQQMVQQGQALLALTTGASWDNPLQSADRVGKWNIALYADSVMRKRKRKMNKHKHRKRRKLLRHKS